MGQGLGRFSCFSINLFRTSPHKKRSQTRQKDAQSPSAQPTQSSTAPAMADTHPAAKTLTTVDAVSNQEFDYIVVGGGTAGLVLATRLSEDSTKSILVLEAGGANLNDPMIDMPASYGKFFNHPDYDWGFMTAPQKHSNNSSFPWARVKGLGGSSGGNFYMWTRPTKRDVDAWERLGNRGWNWENFLKYSLKCETFVPPSEEVTVKERLSYDLKYHGTDGPLMLGFPNARVGWDVILQDTYEKCGIPRVVEPQGGERPGSGMELTSVNPLTNKRITSIDYLTQAASRPNLKVLINAYVRRILLSDGAQSGDDCVASGVEFSVDGKEYVVRTKSTGEVILSAGTIKSPQILELSGIGDPKILSGLNIETKVDLPAVGTNVQEHFFGAPSYELNNPEKFDTIDVFADPAVVERELKLLAEEGRGLFTIGVVGVMFCPFKSMSDRADEIHANLPSAKGVPGLAEQYAEQAELIKENASNSEILTMPGFFGAPNPPTAGKKHMSFCTMINRPFSRGTIHAASSDPNAPPVVDPNYFAEEIDLHTLVEQVKFIRRLVRTEPLAPEIGREVNPGESVRTDEEIIEWIKKHLYTVYHTCGSCSMLPKDKGGVVSNELKVYGTKNLRVVDLSIIPLTPSAHTQAIVYAIAEQASDIIKGVLKV